MVALNEVSNMFWGVTIDGGKRYTQTVEHGFHISMAALEHSSSKGSGPVSVMIQHEKAEFLLCTLTEVGHCYQQPLDLNFNEGEEVTFFLNGKGIVHLTGYLVEDPQDFPYEGEEEEEELSEEDMSSDVSDDEDVPQLQAIDVNGLSNLKRKKQQEVAQTKKRKVIVEEVADEDDDDYDSEDDDDFVDYMEGEESDDEDDDDDEEDDDDEDDDEDEFDEDEEDEVVMSLGSSPSPVKSKKADKSITKVKTPAKEEVKKSEKTPSKDKMTPKKADKTPSKKTPGKTDKTPGKGDKTPGKGDKTPGQNEKGKKTPGKEDGVKKTPAKDVKKTPAKASNMGASGDASATPSNQEETKSAKKKKQKKNKQKGAETPSGEQKAESAVQTPKTPRKRVLEGGVVVEELKEGHGPDAKKGKMIQVYYTGKLQSGKIFDMLNSGKPFKFRLGQQEVIKGWDVGVAGMKVGGKRKIIVPPKFGYGSQAVGKIPPNSVLSFDVELKSVS